MADAGADGRALEVVRALRDLSREQPYGAELLTGFSDAEMDSWTAAVPESVRIVLRGIGGVRTEEDEYVFGPRGRQTFTDGYWTLGAPDFGEGSLIVAVGAGAGAAGGVWGPVVTVFPFRDERNVTIEAPDFLDWLAGLTARLAKALESGEALEPAVPEAHVSAVPSIAAAEGPDAALAALAGPGDSLTDLVDLRALPGYPCGVNWEPYFSTSSGTADTGSSDVQYRFAADANVLFLRSVVSGDFLGRAVRRHREPADAAHRAVAGLGELARRFPEFVRLAPGATDSAMDAWDVPVPDAIRTVLRAVGGVDVAGLPALVLLPGAAEHGVDPELHRMLGGDGTYRPLARLRYGRSEALLQVRTDPSSGQWGHVVCVPADPARLREFPEAALVAESLTGLLLEYLRLARRAAAGTDFTGQVRHDPTRLLPGAGHPWPRPRPVAEWVGDADPLRAAAAAELPAGSYAADLRAVPIPSEVCFHRAREWPYAARLDRLSFPAGGRLVAAVPVAAPADAPAGG
ncbi:hypothetical protein ACIPY6_09000 [Streptomyces sp. NPDC090054]|uniref:hypothetical protein n=1 Tax=Streptomyces sp. NPDC090054 TaxID=3365933 RepID=UPI0037F1BC77